MNANIFIKSKVDLVLVNYFNLRYLSLSSFALLFITEIIFTFEIEGIKFKITSNKSSN
jgi:hypothetical protein